MEYCLGSTADILEGNTAITVVLIVICIQVWLVKELPWE